ncbi:LysR family transcriptional regulator [Pollutimonas nitritireducens]|uniref:LysR family transcriptional regulator n=1 Tax=Pollutimonas nitritireducens TaxID=2045209 RepID=A0A2N4UHV5_9BURK|nr:LysR family transcriptional regulator [Pollutimonas nitritireducens]PLC54611.1 LysR family transcriptional regulator [Pollutimonas nitritireducens]
MTLKQLEAFFWAATCASFAVAAERLHLSVSTLSKRISELEASLGEPLFDRGTYRATLTATGHSILPRVSALLDQTEALRLSVQHDAGLQGHVRFGVGELASQTWLPRFMRLAAERYPGLQLEPNVEIGSIMEHALENGELDFTLAAGTSSRRSITSRPLGKADFVWVAAHRIATSHDAHPTKLLQDTPLVTMPPGAGTHRMIEEWLSRTGVILGRSLACNTWSAVSALLIEAVGVGFLPQAWAGPLMDRGLLKPLSKWPTLKPLHYSLQMRRDDTRPIMRSIQSLLEEVVDFELPVSFLTDKTPKGN